jgi:hypothetical protein
MKLRHGNHFQLVDDLFGETKDIVWVVIVRKFINMVKLYI